LNIQYEKDPEEDSEKSTDETTSPPKHMQGIGAWGDDCDDNNPCFSDYYCDMDSGGVCSGNFCTMYNVDGGPAKQEETGCGTEAECVYGLCVPSFELVGTACETDEDCLPKDRYTCNTDIKQCEADYCTDADCKEDEFCFMGFDCTKLKGEG
jgi:hypothetical protein